MEQLKTRLLKLLSSHGTLVSPDVIEYILSKDDPEIYVKTVLTHFSEMPLFMTIELLKGAEGGLEQQFNNVVSNTEVDHADVKEEKGVNDIVRKEGPEKMMSNIGRSTLKLGPANDYDAKLTIIKDVTGQSTCEGTITDFKKHISERFKKLRRILQQQRRDVIGSGEIARVRSHKGPVKIIGMVNSVRTTKNGHKLIELEDESDSISALINNNSPLIDMSIVNDEVLCIIGKLDRGDLVYVEDIVRPDIPFIRNKNRLQVPLGCLFISDIHIGSTTFLHNAWDRLTKWLKGGYSLNGHDAIRDQIKFLVVSGDVVDGIGVYPSQEKELEISDIYAQYEALAEKFSEIPEHIKMIVQPGNHDAVRLAEPQPSFPTEITSLFSNNITFVGNPCYFSIDTVEFLSYHGRSMDDFVMQIPSVSYNKPLHIMKEMLSRRHLAPVYGDKTPIAPEHQDYLVIDRIPDIFVTGHIHKTAVEYYRDILLINASAWQSQTTYQKMMNFNPDPAQAIYMDLQSGIYETLKFN